MSRFRVDDEDFINRLVNSRKETEELLQQKRAEASELVDSETGMPLF